MVIKSRLTGLLLFTFFLHPFFKKVIKSEVYHSVGCWQSLHGSDLKKQLGYSAKGVLLYIEEYDYISLILRMASC